MRAVGSFLSRRRPAPSGADRAVRGWVLASATTAPVALIGSWTLAAARQPPSFDPVRDTISALAASGARDPWVMTTGLVVLGGAHVMTAAGLVAARPLGRLVLAAGGVAAVLVAAFPQPDPRHLPAATVSFVALALWPALSGLPTPRAGRVASVVLSALLVWLVLQLGGGSRLGLAERATAGAQAVWPLVVALATARIASSPRGEHSPER